MLGTGGVDKVEQLAKGCVSSFVLEKWTVEHEAYFGFQAKHLYEGKAVQRLLGTGGVG